MNTSKNKDTTNCLTHSSMGPMGSELCYLRAQGERGPFKLGVPSDVLGGLCS